MISENFIDNLYPELAYLLFLFILLLYFYISHKVLNKVLLYLVAIFSITHFVTFFVILIQTGKIINVNLTVSITALLFYSIFKKVSLRKLRISLAGFVLFFCVHVLYLNEQYEKLEFINKHHFDIYELQAKNIDNSIIFETDTVLEFNKVFIYAKWTPYIELKTEQTSLPTNNIFGKFYSSYKIWFGQRLIKISTDSL
jgi:hypothetical protein